MPEAKRKELKESAEQSGFVMVNKKRDSSGRVRVHFGSSIWQQEVETMYNIYLTYIYIFIYIYNYSDYSTSRTAPSAASVGPRSGGQSLRESAEYTDEFANFICSKFAEEACNKGNC